MRYCSFLKSSLSVFLVITFAETPIASFASESQTPANQSAAGRAPIKIVHVPHVGYSVHFDDWQYEAWHPAILLSLDGQKVSSLAAADIYDLIYGPTGSKVTIEFFTSSWDLKKVEVTREKCKPQDTNEFLKRMSFDQQGDVGENGEWVERSDLDILARAKENQSVQYCRSIPAPKNEVWAAKTLHAALLNYQLGDFRAGNEYLKSFENALPSCNLRTLSWVSPAVIHTLIALGKKSAAESLARLLPDPRLLEQIIYEQNSHGLVTTFDASAMLDRRLNQLPLQDKTWLVDAYISIGKLNQALSISEDIDKFRKVQLRIEDLSSVRTNAEVLLQRPYELYQLAWLQNANGNKQKALETIDKAVTLYCGMPESNLRAIKTLPLFFPKPADVSDLLSKVQVGSKVPPPIGSRLFVPPSDAPLITDSAYHQVVSCYKAINENDQVRASKVVEELFDEFAKSYPHEKGYSVDQQNLYCTIMQLARTFSDNGWISSSDRVFERLSRETRRAKIPEIFFAVEFDYNANIGAVHGLRKRKSADSSFKSTPIRSAPWTLLRRLATAYYRAGELKRAAFLIEQARNRCNETTIAENIEVERLLVLLNASCIAARTADFKKADENLAEFLSSPSLWIGGYVPTLIELSDLYFMAGRKQSAEKMLRVALDQTGKMPFSKNDYFDRQVSLLEYALADVLAKLGRLAEARSIIDSTIKKLDPNRLPHNSASIYLLAAKLAETSNDHIPAAIYFVKAAECSHPDRHFKQYYLRKALKVAEEAKSFDKEEHARFIVSVVDKLEDAKAAVTSLVRGFELNPTATTAAKIADHYAKLQDRKEALNYYQKAYLLMQESDPFRLQISLQIYEMKHPPSNSQAQPDIKDKIEILQKLAMLSEKNSSKDAWDKWATLASEELKAKLNQQAILHLQKAMSAMHSESHGFYWKLSPAIIYSAFGSQKTDQADDFIAVVETKIRETLGVLPELYYQTTVLELQLQRKDYSRGLKEMESILRTADLRKEAKISDSMKGFRSHCGCSRYCNEGEIISHVRDALRNTCERDLDTGIRLLQSFLSHQKNLLPADDERLALTYLQLGEAYFKAQYFTAAESSFRQYIALSAPYQNEGSAFQRIEGKYAAVLRHLGKNDELTRLNRLQLEVPKKAKSPYQEVQ